MSPESPRITPELPLPKPNPEAVIPWTRGRVPQDFTLDSGTGFHQGPRSRRGGHKLLAWSWLAAAIDALLLVGFTMIFLSVFLFLVKSTWGVFQIEKHFFNLAAVSIFASLSVFYMIMLRSFLGFTIGDWACGIRLGSALERQSPVYSIKVLARTVLVAGTGFITLPVLSLITGRDWAGQISRLSLVSIK